MMSRLIQPFAIVAVVAVGLVVGTAARAADEMPAEKSGPSKVEAPRRTLAERIPNVTRRVFAKQGRVELTPTLGMSLNDPFFDHVLMGLAAGYHFTEWLAIGVGADYYSSAAAELAIAGNQQQRPRMNRPEYGVRGELIFSPIYGKLSLLAETVLHFDMYVSAGGGMVGPGLTSSAPVGTLAVGQHYFIAEWIAIKVELRDQMFMLARNPVRDSEEKLQNLLTASLGVAFYLPPSFQREQL